MDKQGIINILNEIGLMLELKGDNPFKVRAYYNGARALELLEGDLETWVKEGRLGEIEGVGKALVDKITELVTTGRLEYYERLKATVPDGLFDLLKVPGLGPKKVKTLYEKLGITSLGELAYACMENRLLELPGFGKKAQENIRKGLDYIQKFQGRFLFSTALQTAQQVHEKIRCHPAVIRSSIAGSLRRRKETIKDVDILVSTDHPVELMDFFTTLPGVESIIGKGETKASVRMDSGIQVDLRAVSDEQYPYALHHFTGSKEHNTAMRHRAKGMGIKMNEYGLFREDEAILHCRDEEEIFKTLGLSYIPPELRENSGEIEAAEKAMLPVLVEEKDIQGIFHVHSHYSDGIATLEQLAREARKLGYSYLGLADHSQAAYYAGGLRKDDILRQHEEIDRINAQYNDFKILKGIESDILIDGRLDYDENVLELFDFVIASVHSNFHLSREDMTKRILRAMDNPFTTMIGHLTGRLLLSRQEYELDMEAVLEKAAEKGVCLEINANPHRLDLDWRWCKKAKSLGIPIAINPDAHDLDGLHHVYYGIGIARKGWLEKGDILNSKPLEEIEEYLQRRKRAGGL